MPQMRGLPICIAQTLGVLPGEPKFPIHQVLWLSRSEEITATCSQVSVTEFKHVLNLSR